MEALSSEVVVKVLSELHIEDLLGVRCVSKRLATRELLDQVAKCVAKRDFAGVDFTRLANPASILGILEQFQGLEPRFYSLLQHLQRLGMWYWVLILVLTTCAPSASVGTHVQLTFEPDLDRNTGRNVCEMLQRHSTLPIMQFFTLSPSLVQGEVFLGRGKVEIFVLFLVTGSEPCIEAISIGDVVVEPRADASTPVALRVICPHRFTLPLSARVARFANGQFLPPDATQRGIAVAMGQAFIPHGNAQLLEVTIRHRNISILSIVMRSPPLPPWDSLPISSLKITRMCVANVHYDPVPADHEDSHEDSDDEHFDD